MFPGLDDLVEHVAKEPRPAELEALPLVVADALACAAGSSSTRVESVLGEPGDGAVAISIRDLDDVDWATMHHPSSVLIPAIFSEASQHRCSGETLTTALVNGYRAASGFGHWLGSTYRRNWHATSVCGAVGAAAGAVTAAGGSRDHLRRALAIAAASLGGLAAAPLARNGAASMTRAVSAATGVIAARAAMGGLPFAESVFTSAGGVQQALDASRGPIPLTADVTGISLRLFPVTGFGQAAVAAASQASDDTRRAAKMSVTLSPAACAMQGTGWWDIRSAVQATVSTGDPFVCDRPVAVGLPCDISEDPDLSPSRSVVHVDWTDGATSIFEATAPGRVDDDATRGLWERKAREVLMVDPVRALEASRILLSTDHSVSAPLSQVARSLLLD